MILSKDIEWLNGYKNKTCIYAAYKKLISDLRHTQTESESMQKGIPHKWKSKERQGSSTYIII